MDGSKISLCIRFIPSVLPAVFIVEYRGSTAAPERFVSGIDMVCWEELEGSEPGGEEKGSGR